MEEIWKDIAGYEGRYQVSTLGRVRNSRTGRILKPHRCGPKVRPNSLYYSVILKRKSVAKHFLVHRLVAETFIPNSGSQTVVNHIDGDKFNNSVENLEWTSYSANTIHSYNILHNKNGFGGGPKRVIRVEDGCIFNSIHEAGRICGIIPQNISRCLRGVRPTAGGYHWKYL